MKKNILLTVFLVSLLAATSAWPDEEGGSDYAQPFAAGARLDPAAETDRQATAGVVELTGEDLIARGARTAADALRYAAGCYVYNADRWPDRGEDLLRLRGAAPSDVRVYLNGMPIDHGIFGTLDLRSIPADQIALIRVYPGPAPAIFGPEGGNGVVEIITRQAGEQFTARFDARFGDRRSNNFSAGLGDTVSFFQYFVMASHDSASGVPMPLNFERTRNEDGGLREGSAYARNHYRARAGFVFGPRAEAHLSGFYDTTDRDVPAHVTDPNTEFVRLPELDRLGAQLHVRLGAYGPFHLRAEGYAIEFHELREDYAEGDYETLLRERDTVNLRFGGGLTPMLDFGPYGRISMRLGGRHDRVEYEVTDLYRDEIETNRLEAAIDDELQPLPWLNFSVGSGYGQITPSQALNVEPGDTIAGWHGRIGLAVGPFAGVTLRSAAGRNLRYPTVEEWFDSQLGNVDLGAAVVENLEAALAYEPVAETRFELAGFMRRTQDGLRLRETGDTARPLEFADDVNYLTRGVTCSFSSAPLTGLFLAAHYTYLNVMDDLEDDWREVRILYNPTHFTAGEARYRFDFGLGATVYSVFASDAIDFYHGEVLELPWYLLTGARLFYSYRDRVEVYVQGQNLGDVYYETNAYFPAAGRMWEGGLKLTY